CGAVVVFGGCEGECERGWVQGTVPFLPHILMRMFSPCLQMPVSSHWTQTQYTDFSLSLRGTERWRVWIRSSHILTTQRDLTGGLRCCVERVCLDAATGRLSGVGMGLISLWRMKATRRET